MRLTTQFQCSSASRKFLNLHNNPICDLQTNDSFSALQRAENFSIVHRGRWVSVRDGFSALQRAENFSIVLINLAREHGFGFSALQRAENFSIGQRRRAAGGLGGFQCSSASRKFLNRCPARLVCRWWSVSVLFSEPKISQSGDAERLDDARFASFSALQRAENFSIPPAAGARRLSTRFSALQRAENFSIVFECEDGAVYVQGFSALQRAENFSIPIIDEHHIHHTTFQCSSASRKFLN